MRETPPSIPLLAAIAAAFLTQSAPTQDPRGILEAWRSFQIDHRSGWTAEWNLAAGTPSAVYGPGLRLSDHGIGSAEEARVLGRATLRRFAGLLGQDGSTFVEETHGKVHRTHVLVYGQRFGGLRVLDGRADLRILDTGVLAMIGAECFHVPEGFETRPRVSDNVARLTASLHLDLRSANPPEHPTRERLLIWADRNWRGPCRPRLAWEVDIATAEALGRAYVDARTGEFIQFRTHRHGLRGRTGTAPPVAETTPTPAATRGPGSANVTGTVRAWLSTHPGPNGSLTNLPIGGLRVRVQGGGTGFTDATGRFDIPHTGNQPVNVTISFDSGRHTGAFRSGSGTTFTLTTSVTPGTPRAIQVYSQNASPAELAQSTAYYLVDRVNEFVRQPHILGNHPQLATLDSVSVEVNSAQVSCNAQYGFNQIQFGAASGGQCPNMAFSTVVEHEWGHGLDDVFGGISSQGGLSEGWADVVANYYTGQPFIGKDFSGPGQHVRDATNTRAFGTGSSPHEQGESFMGGCWKVREALIKSLGSAAGRKHAETIVLGSILANAATQPAAVREMYILDDDDGNLNNGTPNCRALFDAFTTIHKIPSPLRSCSANPGTFTVFGRGCPGTGSKPSACQSQNSTGGPFVPPPPPGSELAFAVVAQAAMQVTGVELYTQGHSGSATTPVALHRNASGQPAATAAVSGVLTAGGSPGWYKVKFGQALAVSQNERFYIVHSGDRIAVPLLTSGTQPAAPSLVRHPIFSPNWGPLPPGIPDIPAWRVECTGGGTNNAVPELDSPDVPEIGWPFRARVSFAKVSTTALVLVGVSNTRLGQINLPLDLSLLGAAGCNLLTSMEVLVPIRTDAAGQAVLQATLPNDKTSVGKTFYLQSAVLDGGANRLGLAFSNGAAAKIGTR